MAWKRYSDEDILKMLREIEVHIHSGMDVVSACRKAGVSDKTYYAWRKKFGGVVRSQLSEMKSLRKENDRLKMDLSRLSSASCAHYAAFRSKAKGLLYPKAECFLRGL